MNNLYNLLKTIIEKLNATKDTVNNLPQPDWNQNDETAHDYVKNRPFYTGDPVETVLVEESTATFADTGYGFYAAEFPSTFEATVGETYKVSWDGTAYECTCVDFNNKPAIGNLSIAGVGSDTGEPFIIGIFNGERIQIITADTSASHTISISGMVIPVVKIDKKYLVQPDWNQNDGAAPDHVKNRPFYTGDLVETEIIPKTTVAFSEMDGIMASPWPKSFDLIDGKTYHVSWDGTDYICTGILFRGSVPILGNLGILGAGNDTGEPFIFLNQGQWLVASTESATEHVIGIKTTTIQIVQIDSKYLPAATNNTPGISKLAVQVIDEEKDYTTEEVKEIYENIKSRSVIYCLGDNYIEYAAGNISSSASNAYINVYLTDGRHAKFTPTSGVWSFNSSAFISRYAIPIYHAGANIEMNLYYDNIGGYNASDMPAIGCDFNAKGFVGEYIQADSAFILETGSPIKYLWIDADSEGRIYVHKRNKASKTDLSKTQIAMVSDIPTDNHINELINAAVPTVPTTLSDLSDDETHRTVTDTEKEAWNAKSDFSGSWNDLTDKPFKPAGKSYLTFSSPNSFTLKLGHSFKYWDGILEYFTSDRTWAVWNGTSTLSAVYDDGEYVLYLRGTGNTVIIGGFQSYRWILTGTDIVCIGNIENLLDYATVESGSHPSMADYCYYNMFRNCTSLIQAPALPATTLTKDCYNGMFYGCTSLTQAPTLPATTLAEGCYYEMFQGCTSLTEAPTLPATMLAASCYRWMFQGCTSLTKAPALPATTMASHCYYQMFYGCTSLIEAPALPATTLADSCYRGMFYMCTSLTQAPVLPATTLAEDCYSLMFFNCTNLTKAPTLPATTLTSNCYHGMFEGCRSLKLSATKTNEYTQEYRIPSSGDGTTVTDALSDMFSSTGGTLTGTPEINTTYYLSSDNMIARETDIATLNGYVGSMINTALNAIGVAEEGAY